MVLNSDTCCEESIIVIIRMLLPLSLSNEFLRPSKDYGTSSTYTYGSVIPVYITIVKCCRSRHGPHPNEYRYDAVLSVHDRPILKVRESRGFGIRYRSMYSSMVQQQPIHYIHWRLAPI